MCQILNIPYDYCLAAISELQTNAIDKLRARDDFTKTGKVKLFFVINEEIFGFDFYQFSFFVVRYCNTES